MQCRLEPAGTGPWGVRCSHWAVISSGRSLQLEGVAPCQYKGPLDDVVQLPDIAWPAVGQKGLLEGLAKQLRGSLLAVQAQQDVLGQGQDILRPLPQGRKCTGMTLSR